MNIDINLLPKELRARPLVDVRTVGLIVLILALAFAVYYFYDAKSDAQAENADTQSMTEELEAEALSLSTDPTAVQLVDSINRLEAAQNDYAPFIASLVGWGDALDRVYDLVPKGVSITCPSSKDCITQSGNGLVLKGTATSWSALKNFVLALDGDPGFDVQGLPTFDSSGFTLSISVAPGGGR